MPRHAYLVGYHDGHVSALARRAELEQDEEDMWGERLDSVGVQPDEGLLNAMGEAGVSILLGYDVHNDEERSQSLRSYNRGFIKAWNAIFEAVEEARNES